MYDGTITEVANPHLLPVVSRFMTDYLVTEHEEGRIPAQCERIEHLAHAISRQQDGTGQEAARTLYGGDGLALTVVSHKTEDKERLVCFGPGNVSLGGISLVLPQVESEVQVNGDTVSPLRYFPWRQIQQLAFHRNPYGEYSLVAYFTRPDGGDIREEPPNLVLTGPYEKIVEAARKATEGLMMRENQLP